MAMCLVQGASLLPACPLVLPNSSLLRAAAGVQQPAAHAGAAEAGAAAEPLWWDPLDAEKVRPDVGCCCLCGFKWTHTERPAAA